MFSSIKVVLALLFVSLSVALVYGQIEDPAVVLSQTKEDKKPVDLKGTLETLKSLGQFNRKHKDVKAMYQWLNKLENRLKNEKKCLEQQVSKKKQLYDKWKKKLNKVKSHLEKQKKLHSQHQEKLKKTKDNRERLEGAVKHAEKNLKILLDAYNRHKKRVQNAKKDYKETVKKLKINKLKSELRLIRTMFKRVSWLEKLVAKWVKVKSFVSTKVVAHSKNPLQGGKCLCPVVYKPVCGADGITYSSRCVAKCAKVDVVFNGKCTCRPELPQEQKPANSSTPAPSSTEKAKTAVAAAVL